MKQLIALLLIIPTFCFGQSNMGNKQTNPDDIYEFSVSFEKSKTSKVQHYLDRKLGKGNMSFVGTTLDATIALDNGMEFYIKMQPGKLKIVFDKTKNTEKNYNRMKETCDGIKDIIK